MLNKRRNLLWTAAMAVVFFLGVPAGAQVTSVAPHQGGGQGMPAFSSDEYIYDSGVSDNAVGVNNGNSFAWIHHFDRVGGAETLTAISTVFGTPAFPGSCACAMGQDFQVHVWSDPNGDGDPSDAVLLASAAAVITVPVESDVFQTTPIGPIALPESFFIGASTVAIFPSAQAAAARTAAPIPRPRSRGGTARAANSFQERMKQVPRLAAAQMASIAPSGTGADRRRAP